MCFTLLVLCRMCRLVFNQRLYETMGIYMRVSLSGLFARCTRFHYGQELNNSDTSVLDCFHCVFKVMHINYLCLSRLKFRDEISLKRVKCYNPKISKCVNNCFNY